MNLSALEEAFQENFRQDREIGASLSVWQHGKELLTLCEGYTTKERKTPWTQETLVPVFSATKGPAAATFLLNLNEAGLSLESEVRRVWPAFPVKNATFGEMISHQCGLPALASDVPITDYQKVIAAIEKQTPYWEPSTAHGYHPRLVGFMLDECVRRLTGHSLGTSWRQTLGEPFDLDFWIGLPHSEHERVAQLSQGKIRSAQLQQGFYHELASSGTLVNRAFRSPRGLQGATDLNEPSNWTASYPALGGIGSARALAKFYQVTMGQLASSPFDAALQQQMTTRLCNGPDLILLDQTSFSGGFMLDPIDDQGEKIRSLIGSDQRAYGHPGAGGSHAFADPRTGVSFAYVMNQMEVSVLPGQKVQSLLAALHLGA